MTNKEPLKREVRCLYRKLLHDNGHILNVKKIIGFYEEYNDLRGRVLSSKEAPSSLKVNLQPLKMPLYLKWVKQYLV